MKAYSFFFRSDLGSGIIRGLQIAECLNSKMNPAEGFWNDICIYVKILPPDIFPDHSYIDVVDSNNIIYWIKEHPEIGVITSSKISQKYLSKVLNRKDIRFIPQQHCNYEKAVRDREEVKVVGYIGRKRWLRELKPELLKDELSKIGVLFKSKTKYRNRLDVVKFYKEIDIQVIFRPVITLPRTRSALKIYNAGSFKIPTVAYPETVFTDEFKDCFVEAMSIEDLIDGCYKLKQDSGYYNYISENVWGRSKQYHIEEILKRYNDL